MVLSVRANNLLEQNREEIEMTVIDRMQKENKTICEYCGAEKQGIGFFIGASKEANWCMVEGTGKMTCPACYPKAQAEAKIIIDSL